MFTNQLEVYSTVAASYGLEKQLNKGDKVIFAASKNGSLDIIHYYQADVAGTRGIDATTVPIGNITPINYKLKDGVELKKSPDTSIGDEHSLVFSSHIIEILN